jgi:hypothetical protein
MSSPSRHSSVVGGSTAARVINCQGSVAILQSLPKQINTTSEYAEEGTDLHTLISAMIDSDGATFPVPGETVIGTTLITQELMHDCVQPCWEYWLDLRAPLDEVATEVEAPFPGIPGAFGTCDLSGRSEKLNTTWLTDWKMGAGVGVSASYPDPDDDRYIIINEQLLFYACCLRALFPDWFPADVKIVLTIVQPRHQDPAQRTSTVEVENADLDAFEADLQQAVKTAQQPKAPMKIGPWCRFAACKPVCPLHDAPLLDLAAIEVLPEAGAAEHAAALARVMDLAPLAEAIIAEARKQAIEMLEAGKPVPGWKLVAKRGVRKWNQDDTTTMKLLRKQYKLLKHQIYEAPPLKSPAQVEKVLPKGVTIPSELAAVVSSGSTLAPDSDKRPAVSGRHENLADLLRLSLANGDNQA